MTATLRQSRDSTSRGRLRTEGVPSFTVALNHDLRAIRHSCRLFTSAACYVAAPLGPLPVKNPRLFCYTAAHSFAPSRSIRGGRTCSEYSRSAFGHHHLRVRLRGEGDGSAAAIDRCLSQVRKNISRHRSPGPIPSSETTGPRRDGRGLRGQGHHAWQACRDQSAQS